jgi:putative hydrolase of the HAD superfamily
MTAEAISTVLLDCFGTLVALEPPVPVLRAALRELAGVDVDEDVARAAFRAEVAYYVEHHLEGSDPDSLDRLRDECAEIIRAELGDPCLELAPVRAAMLRALRFRAFPDAEPLLRELRRRGVRTVVASNWDCSLPEVLDRAGLGRLLDGVVSSAEVGRAKPDPELLERALVLAGARPEEAAYVGDSLDHDIGGARAAGLRGVLLERSSPGEYATSPSAARGSAPPGVPLIRTLEELPPVLWR